MELIDNRQTRPRVKDVPKIRQKYVNRSLITEYKHQRACMMISPLKGDHVWSGAVEQTV